MSENSPTVEDLKKGMSLKLTEPEISADDIWADDALDRLKVAESLTNLVRDQTNPFVISLNGHWGTGKTFFLKRWQKQLEQDGFQAIYFNAWEDDFCDPLVAIIGQMSDFFSTDDRLQEMVEQIKEAAKPLLMQNILSVMNHFTGLTLPKLPVAILEIYADQRKSKNELKKKLEQLSNAKGEQGQPMVFIIDELDRCRPTFAVELLERVKHVFDVPGMVFVFGINRDELCSSIRSIYGDIESDIYLRRFFDMEFLLPEANSETFCKHLIERYSLEKFFSELSMRAENNIRRKEFSEFTIHRKEFSEFTNFFSCFCGLIGLSLRDIDYCLRTMVFVGKNLREQYRMYPYLLSALIPLRLKNRTLYRKFVQGKRIGAEVMTCIEQWIRDNEQNEQLEGYPDRMETEGDLDRMEIYLYATYGDNRIDRENVSFQQLKLLAQGKPLTHPECLSERTKIASKERAERLYKSMKAIQKQDVFNDNSISINTIRYLASLIELTKLSEDRQQE